MICTCIYIIVTLSNVSSSAPSTTLPPRPVPVIDNRSLTKTASDANLVSRAPIDRTVLRTSTEVNVLADGGLDTRDSTASSPITTSTSDEMLSTLADSSKRPAPRRGIAAGDKQEVDVFFRNLMAAPTTRVPKK